MHYCERYQIQIIDEWRSSYLNYSQLKQYVKIIQDCNLQQIYLSEQTRVEEKRSAPEPNENILHFIVKHQISEAKKKLISDRKLSFKQMAEEVNQTFIKSFNQNLELYSGFVHYKYDQIKTNFQSTKNYYYFLNTEEFEKNKQHVRHFLEYLFLQCHYLSRMIHSNIEAEIRILEKHKLFSHNIFASPQPQCQNYLTIQKCNNLKRQIQCFYVQIHKRTMNKSRERIKKIGQQVQYNKNIQSLFVGILSGSLATIVIFMCIILSRQHIVLQLDPIFNQHFPLWRGISFFIFYAWMLGTNLFIYQRYKISHKIILENQFIRYPKSNDLFKIASFFSIIFIVLFILYSLQLADIIQTKQMTPEWLPLYVWALFIVFLINPLPFGFIEGRKYIFKMLFKALYSIFIPIDFLAEVAINQLFTLINAFQDTIYTICFYTHLNLPLPLEQVVSPDQCKSPASLGKFIILSFLYSLRIWHSIRQVYRNRQTTIFYKCKDFYNGIKFSCGLITTILSFLWRDANNSEILPAWIVFATITTLYSFFWDIRMNFDLFHIKSKYFLLRDDIIFHKSAYYFWIVCTFLLRCTWVLYISPNISKSFLGSPQIFTLVFGYLQIMRRGIWNVLRLEVEQVKNRLAFRAVPKQKQKIEEMIYGYLQKNKAKQAMQSNQQLLNRNVDQEMQQKRDSYKYQCQYEQLRKNREAEKQKLMAQIKRLFDWQLAEKLKMQKYRRRIEKQVKELMQKIYD